MADRVPPVGKNVSRRDFLFVAAVGVGTGAVLGAGITASPARAQNKRPQKAVSYQASPNGKQSCSNCANFQSPSACKLVDGAISPSGWCVLYAAK
jgi:ubiquinol cytochrome c reductase Fe-S subunit